MEGGVVHDGKETGPELRRDVSTVPETSDSGKYPTRDTDSTGSLRTKNFDSSTAVESLLKTSRGLRRTMSRSTPTFISDGHE